MVDSLAPTETDLIRCNCGLVFLLSEVELGPIVHNPLPRPPANWESDDVPSYLLRTGESSRDFFLRNYDFRSEDERAKEQMLQPQPAPLVKNHEINSLLHENDFSKSISIALRRRFWRYLNDSYREKYKNYKSLV